MVIFHRDCSRVKARLYLSLENRGAHVCEGYLKFILNPLAARVGHLGRWLIFHVEVTSIELITYPGGRIVDHHSRLDVSLLRKEYQDESVDATGLV